MSENEIIAQLFIFFIAGYETTTTAVTVILKLLAENPNYIEEIRREAQQEITDMNSQGFNKLSLLNIYRPHIWVPYLISTWGRL